MDPVSTTNPTSEPTTSEPTTAENVSGVSQAESAAPVTLAGVSEPIQSTTQATDVASALADGEAILAAEQGLPPFEQRLETLLKSAAAKLTDADEKQRIGPVPWKTIFSRANIPFGGSVLEAHEIDGVGCLVRSRTLSGDSISEALVLVPGVECKPRSNDPKDGHELLPIGFKP